MTYAPVALFVYNRPHHALRALASLQANPEAPESDLYVFSDGPRNAAEAVIKTRDAVRGFQGFKSVTVIERPTNLGLARSIITGVETLLRDHGRVIVVEDDLILSRDFLSYMNVALDKYADDANVYQISGYMFDVDLPVLAGDAFFLPLTTSWGWATWDRAWRAFDPDMTGLSTLEADVALRRRFDLDARYPYYDMLLRQRGGQVDSWAIRWYLSVFLRKGLVLYPRTSLVANGGMDGSGTHRGAGGDPQRTLMRHTINAWPDTVADSSVFEAVKSTVGDSSNRWRNAARAIGWRFRQALRGSDRLSGAK